MQRVGHGAQAFLGNQFSGVHANAIRAVLDADQGVFELLDEFLLPGGQLVQVLFFERVGPVFEQFRAARRVVGATVVALVELVFYVIQFATGKVELL